MTTKVLNLYSGLGGNRKLWRDVDVTAVEYNESIASFYGDEFPDDEVVVADAHQYLLDHHDDGWDFIWSSPPCQTHSKMERLSHHGTAKHLKDRRARYPDMKLYQEIIMLRNFGECDWVVENVDGYYDPLIQPQKVARHYFWSNFHIPPFEGQTLDTWETDDHRLWADRYGFDVDGYTFEGRKAQILRNCVEPELGLHVLEAATRNRQATLPLAGADGGTVDAEGRD